ncbi:hypothetical protein ABIB25_000678 [Nakamurella sp. UYEF19]|uniref:LysM peptidoglycan-binding domain-containing protein n=1 Tax=Nakamurella sp. UYEF19 TaxID=1756392 RepID=UPI0033983810
MTTRGKSTGWWPDDVQPLVPPTADPPESPNAKSRHAWMQLLLTGAVLVVLAVALPVPWTAVAMALDTHPNAGDPVGETAMLLAAAILVWLLLGWAVVAAAAALLSRLPGFVGRVADGVLLVVAPAMVRRVLLTVVGASMVTGLAACGTAPASTASVLENGHTVAVNTSALDSERTVTAGQTVDRARSWIAVEGSAVHLLSGTGAPLSLVLALDPVVDLDRPARGGAPAESLNLDWPVAVPTPKPPVDVDWPAPATAPALPTAAGPATPQQAGSGRSSSDGTVVVHRGDSLWSIAAGRLPADSSPTEIDSAWRHLYSVNRAVIGADPNLLLPGQILQPPPLAAPAQRTDDRP